MVFLMKNEINRKIEKFLLGFASGVMIAASVWSLLMPSIEMAEEQGVIAWIPASVGFIIGILFLLWIDHITTKIKFLTINLYQCSSPKQIRSIIGVCGILYRKPSSAIGQILTEQRIASVLEHQTILHPLHLNELPVCTLNFALYSAFLRASTRLPWNKWSRNQKCASVLSIRAML